MSEQSDPDLQLLFSAAIVMILCFSVLVWNCQGRDLQDGARLERCRGQLRKVSISERACILSRGGAE